MDSASVARACSKAPNQENDRLRFPQGGQHLVFAFHIPLRNGRKVLDVKPGSREFPRLQDIAQLSRSTTSTTSLAGTFTAISYPVSAENRVVLPTLPYPIMLTFICLNQKKCRRTENGRGSDKTIKISIFCRE